jgi:hypothetical protein
MILAGKVQARPKGTTADNEIYYPWVSVRFSDGQLQDTINAFNGLVEAIESRANLTPDLGEHQSPIIEEHILDSTNIPQDCFARAFVTKARRPDFTFVAPGISLPNPETFGAHNVFPTITDEYHIRIIPPIRFLKPEVMLALQTRLLLPLINLTTNFVVYHAVYTFQTQTLRATP